MAHLDTGDTGVFAAARARGTYTFGFNGERDLDPDHVILDVTRHLEVCIFDAVERVVEGTFEAGETHWGMERGQYGLEFGSPLHPKMTETVLERIEALKNQIAAGEFDPLPATHEEVEPFLKENAPQAGRELS